MKSLALALLLLAIAPADLSWHPKVGQTIRYRTQISFQAKANGADHPVKMDSTNAITFSSADGSKVTMTGKTEEFKASVDGVERTLVSKDESASLPSQTLVDDQKTGERLETVRSSGDVSQSHPRVDSLSRFRRPDKPLEVGTGWSADVTVQDAGDTFKASEKFVLKGVESASGRKCWAVEYSYTEVGVESPMSAEGTFWIDQKDGNVVKITAQFRNVRFTKGGDPTNTTFAYEQVG